MVFTQKILRTEVLRTEGFTHNIFYIQTLLYTETCAHSKLLHATSFYTERFCYFFITYLSCSPSQVIYSLLLFVFFLLACVLFFFGFVATSHPLTD